MRSTPKESGLFFYFSNSITDLHEDTGLHRNQVTVLLTLPELVSALSGLLDVVMALEHVGVACVALAAAAKAARFCIA